MKFCDVNFSWYLVNVFFDAFLDYSKCPDDNMYCYCFQSPHFRNLNFQIFILDNFSATFTDVFRSDGIAITISMHVFSCLSLIMMSGLLALIVLSVCTSISQRMVTFSFSVTVSGWCSYHLSLMFVML